LAISSDLYGDRLIASLHCLHIHACAIAVMTNRNRNPREYAL